MRFGKIGLAAVAAASLISSPVLAQAASPVSKLSATSAQSKSVRVGATSKEESKLAGGSGILIAILAAAAVIGGIVIAADNDSDAPTSP